MADEDEIRRRAVRRTFVALDRMHEASSVWDRFLELAIAYETLLEQTQAMRLPSTAPEPMTEGETLLLLNSVMPSTRAGRFAFICDLAAAHVSETGEVIEPIISVEQAKELLDLEHESFERGED